MWQPKFSLWEEVLKWDRKLENEKPNNNFKLLFERIVQISKIVFTLVCRFRWGKNYFYIAILNLYVYGVFTYFVCIYNIQKMLVNMSSLRFSILFTFDDRFLHHINECFCIYVADFNLLLFRTVILQYMGTHFDSPSTYV